MREKKRDFGTVSWELMCDILESTGFTNYRLEKMTGVSKTIFRELKNNKNASKMSIYTLARILSNIPISEGHLLELRMLLTAEKHTDEEPAGELSAGALDLTLWKSVDFK